MIPFKVFDKEKQQIWVILNYHPGQGQGSYLMTREDDEDRDFEIKITPAEELTKYRFIDFLEDDPILE